MTPPQDPLWKVDLHLHCAEDLYDAVTFSADDLIHKAARLRFAAIAFTLHDTLFLRPETFDLACRCGILLIPGAELRLEGADVVVLNLQPCDLAGLKTFRDLRSLREERGESLFIFAPHPFYCIGGSMGRERLLREIDLFDAIEVCHFHTPLIDLNRPAIEVAQQCGKPLLATSDAHRLSGFGQHYTAVSPAPGEPLSMETLFRALREGRGCPVSPAVSLAQFLGYALWAFGVHDLRVRLERA